MTTRKVAVLGTATTTVFDAPFTDPSWEIWACGGVNMDRLARVDRWFELHQESVLRKAMPPFVDWLKQQPFPVYSFYPAIYPTGIAYPRAEVVKAVSNDWMLTSTIAWMLALAIHEGVSDIGLFGVEMATEGEYREERAGCQHFLIMADQRGIRTHVPSTCALLRGARPYPDNYEDPDTAWVRKRLTELDRQLADNGQKRKGMEAALAMLDRKEAALRGAIDELNHFLHNV